MLLRIGLQAVNGAADEMGGGPRDFEAHHGLPALEATRGRRNRTSGRRLRDRGQRRVRKAVAPAPSGCAGMTATA
jgi:hypothetical protein